MDDTLTIDLVPAVKWEGGELERLELREPTVGEITKAFQKDQGIVASILLISLVSGVARGAIQNLPMSKFKIAADFLGHFTEESPETSAT